MTLLGKTSDQEYGRIVFQNNHLIKVWMPGSLIEHRACAEEIKYKGH